MRLQRRGWMLMASAAFALGALVQCTGEDPDITPTSDPDAASSNDGAVVGDGSNEANASDGGTPRCDRTKAFGAPQIVPVSTTMLPGTVRGGRLSENELELYFSGSTPGGGGENIQQARRGTPDAAFGAASTVNGVNSDPHNDSRPTLTSNRLNVVFDSTRTDGGGPPKLYRARRSNDMENFLPPELIETPGVNVFMERDAFLIDDGKVMYWASERDGGPARVFRVEGSLAFDWGTPKPVAEVNITVGANVVNMAPVLTSDELVIYFSNGPASIDGNSEIYRADRKSKSDPFNVPIPVGELAHPGQDAPTWVSSDDCVLYFFSTRDRTGAATFAPNNAAIWIAERPAL